MERLRTLRDWLFAPLPEPRTMGSIVRWWEARRLFYNVFVGSIGTCSFLASLFFIINAHTLGLGKDAGEPLALLFAWIPVNIGYTAGWFIEVLAWRSGSSDRYLRGPVLMRVGLAFSLLVISLPAVLLGTLWLFQCGGPLLRKVFGLVLHPRLSALLCG